MKIAIDARELSKPQSGGFRTYIKGLLYGLSEIDKTNEYFIYLDRPIDRQIFRFPVNTSLRVVSGNRIIVDNYTLKNAINADNPDVVHFPCNYGISKITAPVVISLMDVICLKKTNNHMSLKSHMFTRYSAQMTRFSIPKADAVITISEYSKQQILNYFNIDNRMTVIYPAGPIDKQLNDPIRDFEGLLDTPYFLALASIDPRKNTLAVIDAFSRLSSLGNNNHLVVVASHNTAAELIRQKAQEYGVTQKIIILTGINDAELRHLYHHCAAFIFASLDEGFGLPPLEAMACGCAVASSNCASMPEILGDAAIYFDPLNPDDIAEKLNMLSIDTDLRSNLVKKGIIRSQMYSWSITAEKTLDLYNKVVNMAK